MNPGSDNPALAQKAKWFSVQPFETRLLSASAAPIRRHVKVQSEAHPYDPAYETYFEKREGDHMRDRATGAF